MIMKEILLILDKYNKNIQDKLQDFVTGCYSLEESSNGKYQVQKTIELNKIYFQGYVLESPLCKKLRENNVDDYSLTDLKEYINKNFNDLEIDCTPYYEALNLYEKANVLENLVDKKIELEIEILSDYVEEIKVLRYKEIDKDKLSTFYKRMKERLLRALDHQEIDNFSRVNTIKILNDIFEYFWSGYPLVS